jgi:phospholipid transport system substrate-binding protein
MHTGFSRRGFIATAAAFAASLGAMSIGTAAMAAATPAQTIGTLYKSLLGTMRQAQQLGVKGRYEQLAPVLAQTYDMPFMSQMAVGRSWGSLPQQQKASIIDAFSRMMVANYASQFDGYSGEKFEIMQTIDRGADEKLVKTFIVQSNGKRVALDYLMRNSGQGWKIVDVYLDGTISELANRRAEFGSILKSSGPEALISSLHKQGDKMLASK